MYLRALCTEVRILSSGVTSLDALLLKVTRNWTYVYNGLLKAKIMISKKKRYLKSDMGC